MRKSARIRSRCHITVIGGLIWGKFVLLIWPVLLALVVIEMPIFILFQCELYFFGSIIRGNTQVDRASLTYRSMRKYFKRNRGIDENFINSISKLATIGQCSNVCYRYGCLWHSEVLLTAQYQLWFSSLFFMFIQVLNANNTNEGHDFFIFVIVLNANKHQISYYYDNSFNSFKIFLDYEKKFPEYFLYS